MTEDGLITEVVARKSREDKSGALFQVRLIHEYGNFIPKYNSPRKIKEKTAELYLKASQFDVLFYDDTNKSLTAFMAVFLDPKGTWMEVVRAEDDEVIGALYLTQILPGFDAHGHFTFWDGLASGREGIIWDTMKWVFDRYDLRRLSSEVPPYQKGVMRFMGRLGFAEEGEKVEAIQHDGEWQSLHLYGITRGEFEEILERAENNGS